MFSTLLRTRLRLGFDLAVSSGQELVTTTADYVEHVVAHTETRVLGLVLETVRDGARLRAGLRAARAAGIEVVLLPVGGSPLGSSLVTAHSGAVAGESGSWEALADDVAAHLVGDLAELGDTLAVLASTRRPVAGRGIATVHDSGAERSLVADLAHSLDVPFAPLSAATRAALAGRLDEGLEAGNPLDVWGGGSDTRALFGDCLATIAADPAVGVTALAVDLVPEYDGDISYPDAVEDVVTRTAAPVVVLTGLPGAVDDAAAERLRLLGVPVLEGFRPGLLALRHLLDSAARPAPDELDLAVDEHRQARWRQRLGPDRALSRRRAGRPARRLRHPHAGGAHRLVPPGGDRRCARRSAGRSSSRPPRPASSTAPTSAGSSSGSPTSTPLPAAYADLAARLGPDVTVHEQVPAGVEISVGVVRDDALGPMVVVAAGGVLVELLGDRVVGLPPLTAAGCSSAAGPAAAAPAPRRVAGRSARRRRCPRRGGRRGLAAGPRARPTRSARST